MSNTMAVLVWWGLVQVFGLAVLPLAFRLFGRLSDRGYGVSKAAGLLLVGYLFWLLGVLGFVRNDSGATLLALALVAGGAWLFYRRAPMARSTESPEPEATLSGWLRGHWKVILVTELLFAATFAGWVLYRAYVPRIMTAGGEKFMELAFLNGIRRSETLPPLDPWLSGYAISYYYFGYLIMSMLTNLSGVAPAVGFNIGGGLLFALTATGAFSVVYNLVAGRGPDIAVRLTGAEGGPDMASLGGLPWHQRPGQVGTAVRPTTRRWTWVAFALLGVVLVVLLSNWEAPLEVAHWNGLGSPSFWRWLDVADLDNPPPAPSSSSGAEDRLTRPGWWWWRASRVIFDYNLVDWAQRFDETAAPPPHRRENIDEFPFFSFLLGDMHPHVLALPFIMLALTGSLALFHSGRDRRGPGALQLFLLALMFGALGFLNTWDFPIQWFVAVSAYALGRLSGPAPDHGAVAAAPVAAPAAGAGATAGAEAGAVAVAETGAEAAAEAAAGAAAGAGAETTGEGVAPAGAEPVSPLHAHLYPVLRVAMALAVGGFVLYLPFYLGFQSQAGGPLVHVQSSTRLTHFTIMFGPLLFILVAFLLWGVVRARREGRLALKVGLWTAGGLLGLALVLLLLTALVITLSPTVRDLVAPGLAEETPGGIALRYLGMRLGNPWVTLLLVGMLGAAVALLFSRGFGRTVQFTLILIIAGAVMTLTPDYVYLKDVFGVRLNTIFKFYYQAWILWAVAAAGAVYVLLATREGLRGLSDWLFRAGLALAVGLGLLYPLLAIPDRVREFPEAPTLDGTVYLAREQPADYTAIQWLNDYAEDAQVVLETPGGGYQYEGRVAAMTGLPTLLGWAGHENQWRGNTLEQDKRRPIIETLYSTTDPQLTLTLLDRYDITYVYVGPVERERWPAQGLQKFDQLLDVIYDHEGVTIYKRQDQMLGGRTGE